MNVDEEALHIKLICEGRDSRADHHTQAIDALALRSLLCAPICTYRMGDEICGAPIWAVDHVGEPRRYVGRAPHHGWETWADCIPPASTQKGKTQ